MTKNKTGIFSAARPGYALEAVLIFLCACVVLGATVYTVTKPEMQSAVYQVKKTAAFYTAEAGLQDALQVLQATPTWTEGFTNKPFMNGFYTVTLDAAASPATLTSKGWVSAATPGRTIQSAVKVNLTTNNGMFDYVLGAPYGCGGITLSNNVVVNGNVFSEGRLSVGNNAVIHGSTTSVAPPEITPVIPKPATACNYTSTMTSLGPCYVNGDLTIPNNKSITLTGTLYVTGKLTLSNNTTLVGRASVYVGDDLTMGNNSVLGDATTTNSPFIYAPGSGDLTISNNGASSNAIIYAPHREITLSNNALISGSVIGHTVTLSNNASATFARVLLPVGLSFSGSGIGWTVMAKSWEEKY